VKFDLRLPIGLLFIAYGAILLIYGLFTSEAMYQCSLGINVNLLWGAVMLVFGGIMFALAFYTRRKGADS